jgi:hypothetical protein
MEILELPRERPAAPPKRFDFQGLSDVLFESADLLEEARASEDAEFRAAAMELAVRSLYTASAAIDRHLGGQRKSGRDTPVAASASAAVVTGPWATES